MSRWIIRLVTGLLLTLLFMFWPFGGGATETGDAQIADYHYDVLPGLHDGRNPINIVLTTGWHKNPAGTIIAIDMDVPGAPTENPDVFASFRSAAPDSNIRAMVDGIVASGVGCREVVVLFFYGNATQPIAKVSYLHVLPGVQVGEDIPVVSGAGTLLGTLANAPWAAFTGDDVAAITALTGDDGKGRYSAVYTVTFEGQEYVIRRFGMDADSEWYVRVARDGNSDGADCATFGSHLHQAISVSTADSLWRNVDRDEYLDDDGNGFPGGNPYRPFCSDTWMFRLQSSRTAPLASPVEQCGAPDAAPANLTATRGDASIALRWDDPHDATITGYKVRRRLSSATAPAAQPWGTDWSTIPDSDATTTRFTVRGGLSNGTRYTVQVRAINANGSGPASTVSATPSTLLIIDPDPVTMPVLPTTCDADTRPGNVAVITAMTTRQDTQWRAAQLPVIGCIEYEERRTVTTYTLFTVTYTCVDGGWFGTMTWHTSTIEGPWTATGNSRSCNLARSATAGRYSLPAGDHELRWDGRRIAFTVPAGATVELRWRQQDDGAYVAVLSIKQGVELVVGADALGGDDQARATRFASTTDPTLSSISASLRDPAMEAPESSVTAPTECPVADPSDDGVTSVEIDAAPCAIVRGGGAVSVALDGESLAITLAAERDWSIMNMTGADEAGTTAAMFFDFLTGGSITLALTDGSELARHIPEGNTDLPALFDAMIPAAPANDGS